MCCAGTCIIAANQAGNSNYAAATQVTQSFTITPRIFGVVPSAGANGHISPDQLQPVTQGATAVFVVTADSGYVANVNGGNQTVPTVKFPDGSALTNPSLSQVKAKLGV